MIVADGSLLEQVVFGTGGLQSRFDCTLHYTRSGKCNSNTEMCICATNIITNIKAGAAYNTNSEPDFMTDQRPSDSVSLSFPEYTQRRAL